MDYLEVLTFLCRVGRKSDPADLFLLFGDDIHCHEDVKGIVNTATDILLIKLLVHLNTITSTH